jgi:hypothetical protein
MFRFGERRTDGARATSRATETKLSFNGRSTCRADNQDCFTFKKIARTKLDRDCRFVKSYLTENIQTLTLSGFCRQSRLRASLAGVLFPAISRRQPTLRRFTFGAIQVHPGVIHAVRKRPVRTNCQDP